MILILRHLLTRLVLILGLCWSYLGAAQAFVILPEGCRADVDKCLSAGQMDWIFIYGEIVTSDATFFDHLRDEWPNDKKLPPIYVESNGGSIDAALIIGRIIHRLDSVVMTGNPILRIDRQKCLSACPLIALAAKERYLMNIGLHSPLHEKHATRTKAEVVTAADTETINEVSDYIDEMGGNSRIKEISAATPYTDITEFNYDESKPLEDQDIAKLGFMMPMTEDQKGLMFPEDRLRRDQGKLDMLTFAAVEGNSVAAFGLYQAYISEAYGRKPDYKKARYWLEFSAEQGNVTSMHGLGVDLDNGHFGYRDIETAITWYRKAAERNYGPSENNLGWNYHTGEGVPKNDVLAVYWITQSAGHGQPFAYGSLCELYGAGGIFPPDDVEEYKWCRLAIDQMSPGSAKAASVAVMNDLDARITADQRAEGENLVKLWKPTHQDSSVMVGTEEW